MIDGNFEMKIAGSLHILLFTVPFKIQNFEQKILKATECKKYLNLTDTRHIIQRPFCNICFS
jgi:hypothetical protein